MAVERAVKNCLGAMWRIRAAAVGQIGIAAGCLVSSKSDAPTSCQANQLRFRRCPVESVFKNVAV